LTPRSEAIFKERHHDCQRGEHDEDLDVREPHGERLAIDQRMSALDQRRQRLHARALRDLHVVGEKDRHADGRDQRRQPIGVAQRPVGETLDRPAVQRREPHGDQQHEEQRHRDGGDADGDEGEEGDQGDEGADHEHVAMGEVDHADDAVDHRVADGDEAIDGAERDAVDELLEEIFHANPAPIC
jgi:hypothetical protein